MAQGFVVLRCWPYEGCCYLEAFNTLDEAVAYIAAHPEERATYEVWDVSKNEEVFIPEQKSETEK